MDAAAAARGSRATWVRSVRALAAGTAREAWRDRIFGLAAEAGFWQLLSLPPLLLAVLGTIGYFADVLGPDTISRIEVGVVHLADRVIVPDAVDSLVRPTLHRILTGGRADVVSIGFLLSLWSGSSAVATYVNTITIAYNLRDRRSPLKSRLLALGIYIAAVLSGVLLLPLLVLGPTFLVRLAPASAKDLAHTLVVGFYWPVVVLLTIAILATLYHLAVPVRTPWHRALPGAVLALGMLLLGSFLLRLYISATFTSASPYGPLSAPIAVLLFFYIVAFAVLFGAELNAELDRLRPIPETSEARHDAEPKQHEVTSRTVRSRRFSPAGARPGGRPARRRAR